MKASDHKCVRCEANDIDTQAEVFVDVFTGNIFLSEIRSEKMPLCNNCAEEWRLEQINLDFDLEED